jgi:hypothetical protein
MTLENQAPAPGNQPTPADTTQTLTDQTQQPAPTPEATPAPANPPAEPPAPAEPPTPETPPADDKGGADAWGELDSDTKAFIGDKTPAQVAKELMNAQALIGKKVIGIPGKDSTPEEQRAFHAARGVPEAPEGYDFKGTLDELKGKAPEGYQLDEAREASFRQMARNANLSNSEANNLIKHYFAEEFAKGTDFAKQQADSTKATQDLVAENWGAQRDKLFNQAERFARHVDLGEDAVNALMALPGVSPAARFKLANFMAEQGALLEEGGDHKSAPNGGGIAAMTPEAAKQAREAFLMQGDNRMAYMDSGHARHAEVSKHVGQLARRERGL